MSSRNQWSVQAIIERIDREKQQQSESTGRSTTETVPAGYSVRGLWSCYADPGALTAAQAHTAMQLHLGCGVNTCRVRRRARTALVTDGRMVLEARATRTPAVARRSLLALLRMTVYGCGALLFGGRHALR
ncbi:hypothetical protein HLB23_25255 [Nocardia uniformis]|uniref:Uncharacterized protein n=1 Tax=Nocardia uniformis TaxID=53432 RepID=A0A849CDC3_9NOCA|nr:hypothetical protein [Nocardia uniformis]NNH73129.1 hypothetical protein [Nocardia uniformis]